MASSRFPGCRGSVCLRQFYREHWRLNVLDISTRRELATSLDVGIGFEKFAERFHFTPGRISHLRFRAKGDQSVQSSPTILLLTELESRMPLITVQQIQRELEAIHHAAAEVIPNNLARLTHRAHSLLPASGIQNTEPSGCICPRCLQPPPYHSMHHARTVHQDLSHSSSYVLPDSRYHPSEDDESWYLNSCSNPHCERCRLEFNQENVPNTSPKEMFHPPDDDNDGDARLNFSHYSNAHCDSCRLENDPEETKVVGRNSAPQNHCRPITQEVRMGPYGSSDPDCISGLHLGSLESKMSSLHSDCSSTSETNSESLQSIRKHRDITQEVKEHRKSVERKFCANSTECEHFVGDMKDTCQTCKKYSAGAIPKNTFRTNSSSMSSNHESSRNTRNSWPESSVPVEENCNIRSSLSDSALSVASLSPRSSSSEHRSGTLEKTLYSRINKKHQSDSNVENITHDSNNVSDTIANNLNERLGAELHLSERVYQNNLDSTGSRSNSNNVTGTLNTVTNNSSNGSRNGNSHSNSFAQNRQSATTNHRPTVFVTYSWNGATDSVTFLYSICYFCKQLKKAGFRVKLDMLDSEYESLRQNKLEWIDSNISQAEFVIVCITPTYQRDIEARDDVSPRCTQLNARYIFDKLREEYYQHQSQNMRMVPVMFTEYGTTLTHVPSIMRSTLIYRYPEERRLIIDTMRGHGSYMPT